jgi:DNA-binding protein Fis
MPAHSSIRSPVRIWCEGRRTPLDMQPIYRLCGHHLLDVERALILAALERCGWNRTHAAKLLGISIRTMRNKITACVAEGIEVPGPCAFRHQVEGPEAPVQLFPTVVHN